MARLGLRPQCSPKKGSAQPMGSLYIAVTHQRRVAGMSLSESPCCAQSGAERSLGGPHFGMNEVIDLADSEQSIRNHGSVTLPVTGEGHGHHPCIISFNPSGIPLR